MLKLKVVISYVIREDDGLDLFNEFMESLRNYPPSKISKLVITVKSVDPEFTVTIKKIAKKKIVNLRILVEPRPDIGFDLGSHYIVGRENPDTIVIFMSASSQVCHSDWFNLLTVPFTSDEVGVVGTMISFESIKDSYLELVQARIKSILKLQMSRHDVSTALVRNISVPNKQINLGKFGNRITALLLKAVCKLMKNRDPLDYALKFPPFPNPHLRTTGYAVRADLLNIVFDSFPQKKHDAFLLESGYSSISRRIALLGYEVLHCDAAGFYEHYDKVLNPSTFRTMNSKSIVSDRESRSFQDLSNEVQSALSQITFNIRK